MRLLSVLLCLFFFPLVVCASDPKAIALLKGVEQERLKCDCFRICYTEERKEEGKTVEQIVDFDNGRIRKEHLKTDVFPGIMSLFLGDIVYVKTSYNANSVNLVDPKSIHASGADTYDPRILGLTDFMNQKTSVQDCLLYTRRKDFSVQDSELNGKKCNLIICNDDYGHCELFIEEPGFRLLRHTYESRYIDIQVDAEYSNPKFLPFPTKVKILRKQGKTKEDVEQGKKKEEIVFDHTIVVTNVEIKKSFPPETFTLASMKLPVNATVTDYRINRIVGYWDGEKLVDKPVRMSVQERREWEKKQEQPSQILRVDCGSSGFIRAEFNATEKSERHIVKLSVGSSAETDIDEKIALDFLLFPSEGRKVKKSCPVSVYRFASRKTKP
jgi:hypothetical protein